MSDINEMNVGMKWYVVHTYSGYENKVKANLEKNNVPYKEWDEPSMIEFASKLAELNKKWGYELATCGEKIDIEKFGQFDDMLEALISKLLVGKGFYKGSSITIEINLKALNEDEILKLKDALFEKIKDNITI